MSEQDVRARAKALAMASLERGDAVGWFEQLCEAADGDTDGVPWADLEPLPWLVERLPNERARSAVVVGCGLGDDVAAFAEAGWDVHGFDVAETPVAWARRRFPGLSFGVEDLFAVQGTWDVVWECYTVQALPLSERSRALRAVAGLVAPGGELWISQRLRPDDEQPSGPPWPLSRAELAVLEACGLSRVHEEVWPEGEVTRFAAIYRR